MKIFTCSANPTLANDICRYLQMPLGQMDLKRFTDQEVFVRIQENVRGEDVFIIQPTNNPANDHLMELLVTIDAAKRGSAKSITAVIPYFGYARQDRKTGPRTPISAKLVANMISTAGADRVLTMDLHAGQVQGFFDVPVDNLYSAPVIIPELKKRYKDTHNLVIVSPDIGGVVRARAMATKLDTDLAIIDKRRPEPGISEVMNIIGDVNGKDCVLMDDMIDSGGTLCNAAKSIKDSGAKSIVAYCTHGVFSPSALDRLSNSSIEEMIVTDTIATTDDVQKHKKTSILSIAPLMAQAIQNINNGQSVSQLFDIATEKAI